MVRTLSFRNEVIWSTAAVVAFALALVLVGCGGEDAARARAGQGGDQDNGPTAAVKAPPPPDLGQGWVETESEEEEVLAMGPPAPREVTYEEAESIFFARDYGQAAELFALYTERRPENPWGFYMLGLSAWKAGEYESSEAAFSRALELDPLHVKSWLNLARVYLDTQRAEEALAKIDEALFIDESSSVGHRLKGRAFHQLGRIEEAIDAYHQAILSDDQDAWSMNNLGLILIEQEQFVEALPPLARAVELRDDVAIFQNNLGIALERVGYFTAAYEAYKSAIAIDGSHERAYANLGRVEGVEDDPGLEPVDLSLLAQGFLAEIEGWREAVAQRDWPDFLELEPVVISEADTIPKEDER